MFDRILIGCCAALVFSVAGPSAAQFVRVGTNGPIPLGTLDEMESAVDLAAPAQKSDLLARLGVDPTIAEIAANRLLPGEKIVLRPLRGKKEGGYAVLFLPSGTGTECSLYLLSGSDANPPKSSWRAIDHRPLNCWDGTASLELMPLRLSDSDDIVLHHVNKGHGSGLVADQTQVFTVLKDKLLLTLATGDFLLQATAGTNDSLEQRSTFLRFPDLSLEETRTSAMNGALNQVQRRYWRWSEPDHKLIQTPFVAVAAPQSGSRSGPRISPQFAK